MRQILHEEDGLATTFTTLALTFGILALLLLFLPFMNNYTSRRFAQNGADAAAHAGAGQFADDFSDYFGFTRYVPYINPFDDTCPSTLYMAPPLMDIRDRAHERAVYIYRAQYMLCAMFKICEPVFVSWAGFENEARHYAQGNDNIFNASEFATRVSVWHPDFTYHHDKTGIDMYPVLVDSGTTYPFTSWTNANFETPAYAHAMSYITDMDTPWWGDLPVPTRCDPALLYWGCYPCLTWEVIYEYQWETAFVREYPSAANLAGHFLGP